MRIIPDKSRRDYITGVEKLESQKFWSVYIIETQKGRLYTGITTDLKRRFSQHLTGNGARYFRFDPPKKMVWNHACLNRSGASKMEFLIKKMPASKKWDLIGQRLTLVDLGMVVEF